MEEQTIKLVQKPVITHKLFEVGKSVTDRIYLLNIDKLIATDETIQSLKQLRADLNKEHSEFEAQRKALKDAVAGPYVEFENVYKVEISEKYKNAVNILKDKITAFEDSVKKEKKANIELYFAELCTDAKIDFLKFKDTGIEINLSTSEKQYKDKCAEFVNRVQDDVLLIQSVDYQAETLAEYKSNGFNASKAIKSVRDRKEQEKIEADRIKEAETNRRLDILRGKTFIYHDMTRTYHWVTNEEIFISLSDIENLSPEDFKKSLSELELRIKEQTPVQASEQKSTSNTPVKPLQKPVEISSPITEEKKVTASFEVIGTMSQLMALGKYMKDNKIIYKNI